MLDFLEELGIDEMNSGASAGGFFETGGGVLSSDSPCDGQSIARIKMATQDDYEQVMAKALDVFPRWRMAPAPLRGEIVRQMGEILRTYKSQLGQLVAYEMGKIVAEGEGEVQEMIDIADFAVGLSRQLYGLNIMSERPQHRLSEVWHPLGCVGIISAFNFPVAVWSWNAFLAAVCGDVMIWKPSLKTPLCAIAVQKLMDRVLAEHGFAGAMGLVIGSDEEIGETLIHDTRIPLVSATGSCRMGRHVNQVVAKRLGRCLLELGGNNALVVMPDADLDLALNGVLFGAVGTAGQRCTTTRRLLVHEGIAKDFIGRLERAYAQVRVGHPLDEGTLMGPLIDQDAVAQMQKALKEAVRQGGEVLYGGEVITGGENDTGTYVKPALVLANADMPIVKEETFAPILYVLSFGSLDEAIAIQNDVPQGLSSAIFTDSMRQAEAFLSAMGSDCGIANVNVGTSGAEIGGAFGGEKDTGGGREAGSDAWKAYMRRQTQTINWSTELPLAQGISFG
ncbi:MAG: aldehyde dehydrogenase family protein [Myxococcota bacterium]|jgi:aldehyde dehydrogenase (NAD+)|nr:aldehyde dehydrogenase family protein [Myxococcota bacterium]